MEIDEEEVTWTCFSGHCTVGQEGDIIGSQQQEDAGKLSFEKVKESVFVESKSQWIAW